MTYHTLLQPVLRLRPLTRMGGVLLCLLVFIQNAWADSNSKRIDLSELEALPHELALTQVFSEICPPMLNHHQKNKFMRAYQAQLQSFMPTLNTAAVMQQINSEKEYKKILTSMRVWTLSYPKEENRALCIEFAESSF